MNTSERVGKLIKELRRKRNLTGMYLSKKAGISQSKLSKIETGRYPKQDLTLIDNILNILDAPRTIRQQLMIALDQRQDPASPLHTFSTIYDFCLMTERERAAKSLKSVTLHAPHALLQTADYRLALLRHYKFSVSEIQSAMNETTKRQDMLWDARKRYHFILQQAGLYSAPAGNRVQIVQLDRLERLLGAPTVRIGIVPTEAGMSLTEHGNFVLYDDIAVVEPVLGSEPYSTDVPRIAEYVQLFAELEQKALYGDEARQLIRTAADYFS